MNTPELPAEEIENSLLTRFKEHLERRHLRKTPERFAILQRAIHIKGHFSGSELYSLLDNEGYHVSRMTVYSTLELLCECGLVNRHMLDTRSARYEMALGSHCHLICMRCGKVCEVAHPDLGEKLLSQHPDGFRPSYFSTSVYGICAECVTKTSDTTS